MSKLLDELCSDLNELDQTRLNIQEYEKELLSCDNSRRREEIQYFLMIEREILRTLELESH